MDRYLITQSLLASWAYTFDAPAGYEDDAMDDFLATLRREPKEQTEAMLNGIEFENAVYAEASGKPRTPIPKWENGIRQVAGFIRDAPTQVRLSRGIEVDGMNFLVYGVLDALKCGTIIDVKFVNKRFNSVDLAGKYLESPQHPVYFYLVPEAHQFVYLVSDGEDLYREAYCREDARPVGELIHNFVEGLKQENLLDLYKEKWLAQ